MKKKLYYILIALTLPMIAGCSSWLDVKPQSETRADDVYRSEDGFRTILNGVYIQMASTSLYGRDVTFYLPELLARNWLLTYPQLEYNIGNYQYTNAGVEGIVERIWGKYYNCIAHLNDIITNADRNRDVFTQSGYDILTGEAYGLRAFLHFEMLRWFGPVPEEGLDGTTKAVPYMEELTKDPNKMVIESYDTVVAKILRDLEEAEKRLANDPVRESLANEVTGAQDEWYRHRQSRFNYWAVIGTKARYYQWIGQGGKAAECALAIINAKDKEGEPLFNLATESYLSGSYDNGKLVFRCEHLFGVHFPELQSILPSHFKLTGGPGSLSQSVNNINNGYETAVNPDDIRCKGQRYWNGTIFLKYTKLEQYDAANLLPVMRLSEMYLIMMEELPQGEAAEYFETYRKAKNMHESMDATFAADRTARIEKEYRKEFFGEGQMWFYYKRHKTARFNWPSGYNMKANNYVLPVPKSVSAFENEEEEKNVN